jgi:hypothetical protein
MENALDLDRVQRVRENLPKEGLFAQKEWLASPQPFMISAKFADELERLGHWLLKFIRASNRLYQQSVNGKKPAWIAEYLDAGKPSELIEISRKYRYELPQVIRPDLILTEEGFAISELDSVPGGIGLTGWLSQTYRDLGFDVLGGADGMIEGFRSILPEGAVAVSKESETYLPEMQWLVEQLTRRYGDHWILAEAEAWDFNDPRAVYRFFELFDLPNLPSRESLIEAGLAGRLKITPPIKPYLEEKLWFALFWAKPLQSYWRRNLSDRHWRRLKTLIPKTWVLDPSPIPHQAVVGGNCAISARKRENTC